MKKLGILLCAFVFCVTICACDNHAGGNRYDRTEVTSGNSVDSAYVGQWKANVKVSSEDVYEVYVITLNADGTGAYRDRKGTWAYSAANQTIVLTVPEGTVALKIGEENGITVLKYYRDTYYPSDVFDG